MKSIVLEICFEAYFARFPDKNDNLFHNIISFAIKSKVSSATRLCPPRTNAFSMMSRRFNHFMCELKRIYVSAKRTYLQIVLVFSMFQYVANQMLDTTETNRWQSKKCVDGGVMRKPRLH